MDTDDLSRNAGTHFLISFFPDSKNLNLLKSTKSADLQSPCASWSGSDPVQRFKDLTAAKQFVFIRVYSWLAFADGCG